MEKNIQFETLVFLENFREPCKVNTIIILCELILFWIKMPIYTAVFFSKGLLLPPPYRTPNLGEDLPPRSSLVD